MRSVQALALIAAVSQSAASQSARPPELGFDGSMSYVSLTRHTSSGELLSGFYQLDAPVAAIRAAFSLNDRMAVEPAGNFSYVSSTSSTALAVDIGLLVELSKDRHEPQWFVRPFVGWQHNGSLDRATAGAGAGLRVPVTERIAMRYEARYRHLGTSLQTSGNVLSVLAGVSVFTR